jgi:tetratricopeptide (TPR) repeat protein
MQMTYKASILNRKIAVCCFFFLIILSACKNPEAIDKKEIEKADSLSIRLNSPELKALNAQLIEDPSNPELYNKRSQLYIQYKQFDEAIGDAQRAIRIDSSKADYFITLADVYFAQNQTRLTKEVLERTVLKFPENTDALMKLSELFFIVKQYQKAIENINKALKVNENIARAYYLKGSIYRESGDTSKAVSSLETAVEQDNNFVDAFYDLGIIYAARKNTLAFEYFNNVLRVKPFYSDAWYAKAKLLQDIGKFDEAIETYEALLVKDNTYNQANYNLGAIYLDVKKEYKKAVECFTKAVNLDNTWAAAYFARGYSYAQLGDKQMAINDYRKCLQIDANYSDAIIGLRELK